MGAYLSAPITEKETEEGELHGGEVSFGVSAMQGWRRGMEDAHIGIDLEPPRSDGFPAVTMFGVWDGHGGKEVARYVKRHMCLEVTKLQEYQEGAFGAALVKAFHKMDELLWDQANLPELNALKKDGDDDGEEDESESEAEGSGAVAASSAPLQAGPRRRAASESSDVSGSVGAKGQGPEDEEDGAAQVLQLFKTLLASKKQMKAASAGGGGDGGGGGGGGVVVGGGSKPTVCNLPSVHVTAGCTSVVALLIGAKQLVVANAGDSRAVLCRSGEAVALSEDHKPSQKRELDRIERVGGFVNGVGRVNGNLNLSRSLGDLKYKQASHAPPSEQMITAEPDVTSFDIDPVTDEFMILACDGIWDCFSNEAAVRFVRLRMLEGMSPVDIAKDACDVCLAEDPKTTQGIGGDNMTCLIVKFKAPSSAGSPF
mmetsp:Transcript_77794/g.155798  ORF Transcript_77794/g.155798 Transcript_77794/m.155798 type:complete len:427 (+) Transcript_77794:36-1316(+)